MTNIAVCVPARDEAGTLPSLLKAIDRQTGIADCDVTVCLLLDGCRDHSAELIETIATRCRLLAVHADRQPLTNAGLARGRAMDIALRTVPDPELLLLTTDADSVPAADWIARMRHALSRADVVAGRIRRIGDHPSPSLSRVEAHLDRLFALRRAIDPVEWEAELPHHQTGGANLGFSAAAYRATGGFAPVVSDEDVAIVAAAHRAGLHVRRDPGCVVFTSDRREGRAPGGLAETLARLDDRAAEPEVDHPHDEVRRYRHHAAARMAFAQGDVAGLGTVIGIPDDIVHTIAADAPNGEAFACRVVPRGDVRRVPIAVAEQALDAIIADRVVAA